MSDIVLCSLNSQYIHSSLAPWYLKAGLLQYGCTRECAVLEPNINQPFDRLLRQILLKKPRMVAFCCYIWNIKIVLQLVPCIKAVLPECVIVLGGPEVSSRAENAMAQSPDTDYCIMGAGEYAFALLALGKSPEEIPNLVWRKGSAVMKNPVSALPLPPPSPYTDDYFAQLSGRISYFESSRGCPFSCAFCLSGRDEGVSFFPMEQVRRDLLRLAKSGTRTVKFVDRTFNCRHERAKEIWRYLIDLDKKGEIHDVCFHFEIGADLPDEEEIALLSQARVGLFQLEAGLQSFHEETLTACNRRTDMQKLVHNLKALIAPHNMHVHIDLIAGLPYEDYDTFTKSFNKAYALSPSMLQLGFLKLIYGSRFRSEIKEYGFSFSPFPPYEILCNRFISYDELTELKYTESALDRVYNSGRFPHLLALANAQCTLSPYEFYHILGRAMAQTDALSYPALCVLLFRVLKEILPVPALRDALSMDILASTGNSVLPAELQVQDARLSVFRNYLKKAYPAVKHPASCLVYDGGTRGVMADADDKDAIFGLCKLYILPESEWNIIKD